MPAPMIPAKTIDQELREAYALAKHLADRHVSKDFAPMVWRCYFRQVLLGILDFQMQAPERPL